MANIIDYKCLPEKEVGIDSSRLIQKCITYPEVHTDYIQMKELSCLISKEEGISYCKLPFCHTVEGEALGGIINLGDHKNGPRGKDYAFSKIEELVDLKNIDFETGRINQVLKACSELKKQGEKVMLAVSGPFTILNLLIEPRYIFKAFKKNPDVMKDILSHIMTQIVTFVSIARDNGVDIISYGDSIGGLSILGPELLSKITEQFTYPLLKRLEEIMGDQMVVHLCPKTSLALVGTEMAVYKDVILKSGSDDNLAYHEAMTIGAGCFKFIGETCVKNHKYVLKNGVIRSIILI